MIDSTLVQLTYALLAIAGLTAAAAVAGIVLFVRDLRTAPKPAVVTIGRPVDLDVRRAA